MADRINYIEYCRKSSEDDARQVQSIADQQRDLEGLTKRLNIHVIDHLTESHSAKTPGNRPEYAAMIKRLTSGEANGIVCWHLNRLSRNPVESGELSWLLQTGVIKSIRTMDREYRPEDNVLLFNVESGMANQFIRDLSQALKRGLEGKVARGWYPQRAPLGYKNDKLARTITDDADRFETVRKMWDLMLTGSYLPSQILEIAYTEWGFRMPKGGKMGLSTLYSMFSNVFYTGMFEWRKQYHQGNHKAMITMDEFDAVQILLGRKGKPRPKSYDSSYTGMILCDLCQSMYTASHKTKLAKKTRELKTYVFYHCTGRSKHRKGCKNANLTLKELEDQISIEVEKHTINPKFKEWALEVLNRENDYEVANRQTTYEAQQKAINDAQTELDNLTRMCYRQLIDEDAFARQSEPIKQRIAALRNNLRNTEDRAEKWQEMTERAFNFVAHAHWRFLAGSPQEKREILGALGSNFSIKDKKLIFDGRKWLVPIQEAYPELASEYKRIELDKKLSVEQRNAAFSAVILSWCGMRESNSRLNLGKVASYH